jgi:hypothetical protein
MKNIRTGEEVVPKYVSPKVHDAIQFIRADKLPVDSMGYPVGPTSPDVAKAIRPPLGVSPGEWRTAIEVATEYFRATAGTMPPTREALEAISSLPPRVWNLLHREENLSRWQAALAVRGILKKGSGLTHDQLLALRAITDVTMKGDIASRLRRLGVSWETYQNWMRDQRFSSQLQTLTSAAMEEAQPLISLELTRGAVAGDLSKVKYFHELTGKAPATSTEADVKAFMVGLIEVLQGEISNPDQLRRIAERLTNLKNKTIGPS